MSTANGGSVDAQGLRDAVSQTLDPLRQHLATVEEAISAKEAELAELKELRRLVAKTLGAADPNAVKPGPKQTRKPSAHQRPIFLANIEHMRAITAEHADDWPDGFRASDVARYTDVNKTTVAKCLEALADEGALRLDRLAKGPSGGKFYKLTAAKVS